MNQSDPQTPPKASEPPKSGRIEALGCLTSLIVHGTLCLLLGLLTFPDVLSQTFDLTGEATLSDEFDDDTVLEESIQLDADLLTDPLDAAALAEPVVLPDVSSLSAAALPNLTEALTPAALTESIDTSASVALVGGGIDGRTAAGKAALVESKGGSKASEVAVARALKWIQRHQNPDGTWSLVHNLGDCRGRCRNPTSAKGENPYGDSLVSGTGLALLPLLGAGQTHQSGRYRKEIRAGLFALARLGEREEGLPGLSWRDSGRMYSHGIATIVLCEAYGLTGDKRLRRPAEAALAYLVAAQGSGGGWRYAPRQPGDTSVTGWQLMGLKSAALAGLNPPPSAIEGTERFLDSASVRDGSAYGYLAAVEGETYRPRQTMTAVGLLCRQYLGWGQDDPRLIRGVEALAQRGPIAHNYYHNYYAAQAIFHQTGGFGATWRKWNEAARDQLIELQATRGHERGSWWGPKHHNERGGRLYATAMATMTLEVYYRYLPIYQEQAVE